MKALYFLLSLCFAAGVCCAEVIQVELFLEGHKLVTKVDSVVDGVIASQRGRMFTCSFKPNVAQKGTEPYSNICAQMIILLLPTEGKSFELIVEEKLREFQSADFGVNNRLQRECEFMWIGRSVGADEFRRGVHMIDLGDAYVYVWIERENFMDIPLAWRKQVYSTLEGILDDLEVDGRKYDFDFLKDVISGYLQMSRRELFKAGEQALRDKSYEVARDSILKAIQQAEEKEDYGDAYWFAWTLAKSKNQVWSNKQRIEWYELAESHLEKRDRENYKWMSVDLSNYVQLLCEKETLYSERGEMGAASLVYRKAEDLMDQYRRHKRGGSDIRKWLVGMRITYSNLLMDKAKHLELAGRLFDAEKTFGEAIEVAASCGNAKDELLCRVYNNYSVLLNFMGRDLEGDAYARKYRELKNPGDSELLADMNETYRESAVEGPSDDLVGRLRVKVAELHKARRYDAALATRRRIATVLYDLGLVKEALVEFDEVIAEALKRNYQMVVAESHLKRADATTYDDPLAAEQDMLKALQFYRLQGVKTKEYYAYKYYARILKELGKFDDALFMINEALRLNAMMEAKWVRPPLLVIKVEILEAAGYIDQAESIWKEAFDLLDRIPDLAEHRRLYVLGQRMHFLARMGRVEELSALKVQMAEFVEQSSLTEHQKRSYVKFDEKKILRTASPGSVPGFPVQLEPFYVATRSLPGVEASALLWLINPNGVAESGALLVESGQGIRFDQADDCADINVILGAGKGQTGSSSKEISLDPESVLAVRMRYLAPPAKDPDRVLLKWIGRGEQQVKWDVVSDAAPMVNANVNASVLLKNPFYNVPVYHEVAAGGGIVRDFRFESSHPCRLEIYDMKTMDLIAVDAQGNGSFMEQGDMLCQDNDNSGFPDVSGGNIPVVCFVFPVDGVEYSGHIDLTCSVLSDGSWVPFGSDRLILE